MHNGWGTGLSICQAVRGSMAEPAIILIGGGGHCRACIDVIEASGKFRIAGIVEKKGKDKDPPVLGYPVIGYDSELLLFRKEFDHALITVGQTGTPAARRKIFNDLKVLNFILPVIISPLAYVSKYAAINEGTIVMHHVIVNAGAKIGTNCILNTKSLVEHDVTVGDHTHISTAAVVNGDAMVGSGCFIGSNTTVVHGARLPDDYFFKAGTLVINEKNGRPMLENT